MLASLVTMALLSMLLLACVPAHHQQMHCRAEQKEPKEHQPSRLQMENGYGNQGCNWDKAAKGHEYQMPACHFSPQLINQNSMAMPIAIMIRPYQSLIRSACTRSQRARLLAAGRLPTASKIAASGRTNSTLYRRR